MGLIHKNRCKSQQFFKLWCRKIDKLFNSLKGVQIICSIWARFTEADVKLQKGVSCGAEIITSYLTL